MEENNKGTASKKAGKFDFSFALLNNEFADCSLRLHVHGPQNASKLGADVKRGRPKNCGEAGVPEAAEDGTPGPAVPTQLEVDNLMQEEGTVASHPEGKCALEVKVEDEEVLNDDGGDSCQPLSPAREVEGTIGMPVEEGSPPTPIVQQTEGLAGGQRSFEPEAQHSLPSALALGKANWRSSLCGAPGEVSTACSKLEIPAKAVPEDTGTGAGLEQASGEDPAGSQGSQEPHSAGAGDQNSCDEERVIEIPVCTVILCAKSDFFRRMFLGRFKEAASRKVIDVHISTEEQEPLTDLLTFVYSGSFPTRVSGNVQALLQVLVIADRFAVADCIEECLIFLASLSKEISLPDAISILSLPESVRQAGGVALESILSAAEDCIRKHCCPLLRSPGQDTLMELPEPAIVPLLEAESLGASEDDLALFSLLWVYHHHGKHVEALKAFARIIMPSLRFHALSPSMVKLLCSFMEGTLTLEDVNSLLKGTLCTSKILSDFGLELLRARLQESSESEGEARGLGKFKSCPAQGGQDVCLAAMGDKLLSLSELYMVTVRTLPAGRSLTSMLTGRPAKRSRIGTDYRAPSHCIHLDIPLQRCRDWRDWTLTNTYLATSSYICANGMWMCLAAAISLPVGSDADKVKLRLSLKYDPNYGGKPSSKCQKVPCQFSLLTASSIPAYQALWKGTADFTEKNCTVRASNFLQKSWSEVLAQHTHYMPAGALQMRADIWMSPFSEEEGE